MQHQTQISTVHKTQLVMRPGTEAFLGSNYTEYQTAYYTAQHVASPSKMPVIPAQVHLAGTNKNSKGIESTSTDFTFVISDGAISLKTHTVSAVDKAPQTSAWVKRGPNVQDTTHVLGSFGLDSALLKKGNILNPCYGT